MDDKLEILYKSYIDNGILSPQTTFEDFSNASDAIIKSLHQSGIDKNVVSSQTDLSTFQSAWGVKKKGISEPVGDTKGTMASTTEQAPAEDGLSVSPTVEAEVSLEPQDIKEKIVDEKRDLFLDLGLDEEKSKQLREKLNAMNNPIKKVNSLNELKLVSPESFQVEIPKKEKITEAQKKALRFAIEGPTANLTDLEKEEYKKIYNEAIDSGNVPIVKTPLGNAINPSDLLEIRKKAKENVLTDEYVAKAKSNDEELINQGIYDNREQIRERRYKTATMFLNELDKVEYDLLAQLKQDNDIIKTFEESEFLPNKEQAIAEAKAKRDKTQKNLEDHRIAYIKKNDEYISELRARLAQDPDNKELKEKLLKAQNRYKAFINPAKEAKKIYTDNPEIQKEEGETPLEKLQNYYDGLLLQLKDSDISNNELILSTIPIIGDITGADEAVSKYADIYKKVEQLTPIVLLNRKALREDNFFSQVGKTFIGGMSSAGKALVTTEQEEAEIVLDALAKSDILENVSKEQMEALEGAYDMTTGEKIGSTLGATLSMMPAFASAGFAVRSLKNASRLGKAFDKLKDTNKFSKFLLGAAEQGLTYEAASFFGDESVEEEASFLSGALGETFAKGLSAVGKRNIYMQLMAKAFGRNAPKAHRALAIFAQRSGMGLGETAEEYGNEFGSIINESDGSLSKMKDLWKERFGSLDKNLEFGLMTYGMGIIFGSATKAGQSFADSHKEWLAGQSDEVKAQFQEISKEVNEDIKDVAEEVAPEVATKAAPESVIEEEIIPDVTPEAEVTEEVEVAPEVAVEEEIVEEAAPTDETQEFIEEEAQRLENLVKEKNPQFQLDEGQTSEQKKQELEKQAVELFSSQDEQEVGDIAIEAETPDVTPTPVEITENKELTDKVKTFKLKDIIGKKLNLLMADKLKVELKDPSKPYNEETNPYVKMGGNFFPLMEKMFGKVGWASIKDGAATKIIKGAMDGDQSVVYNMGDGGIYSNIIMAEEINKKIPQGQKTNLWNLVKEQVQKSTNNNVKKAKKYLSESNDILSFFKALQNEDVDTRAKTLEAIVPESLDIDAQTELFKQMQSLGISLQTLVDENSEQFVKDQPVGALTMVVEITNKDGVKVSDLKKEIDEKLANKQITKKEYNKAYNDIIVSAKMNLEQQESEGIPKHPNYPIYIRGRAVGVMGETVPFYRVTKKYFGELENRALGLDQKKTGKVKEDATEIEVSVYDKIQEAKRALEDKGLSAEEKKSKAKEITQSLIDTDVKKLKGDVKKQTNLILNEIIESNNKANIKEKLAEVELPFSKLREFTRGEAKAAAMTSAMQTGTTAYEVTEKVASAYEKFVNLLTKAFPSVNVSTSVDEFDTLLKDLNAKALSTKNQKIYGAVYNGKLYLNPAFENFNTPVHEFGHIWINVAKQLKPELYRKGMELVQGSSYESSIRSSEDYNRVIKQMKKDGATQEEINTYIQEEALATAIGDKGESFFKAAKKRAFKDWLKDLFINVKKLMGISQYTAEQIENITLDEFVQAVTVDLLSGKKLFDAKVDAFTDALQLMTAPSDSSINDIVTLGRQEDIPDAAIRELLRKKGFKKADIDEALKIEVDFFLDMPIEFERVADGASSALKLLKDVRSELSKFVKKNKNASVTEIREKGIELLKANPIYKKQNRQVKQELISGFEKTISNKKASLSFQKKMSNLRRNLRNRKIGSNDLAQVKAEMKRFIMNNLIASNRYTKSKINQLIRAIADTDIDNIKVKSQRVLDIINKQREIAKDFEIRDIQSILRKKSRKKDKTVDAESKVFFKEANKVLKAIRNNNTEEISRTLDENAAVIDEIQERYNNGEKLTKKESELYNKFLAFSMFENIGSMSLEQVQEINQNIKIYRKKAIERLNAIKTIQAEKRRAIAEKAESQIKKTNPEMFSEDGVLLNKDEMAKKIQSIYENFRKLKIPTAIKDFIKTFKFGTIASAKRNVLNTFSHLETLSNILDKATDNLNLFRENIYDALNIMNTNYLDGKDKTLDKINNIAKDLGFKKGYKGVKMALHSKGSIKIPGIFRSDTKGEIKNKFTASEAMRIYALSLNEDVRKKLLNQGFTEEKIEAIKKHLGKDLVSFTEDIVSFLSNEYFEGINDVYSSTNNQNLGYIENYFPLSTVFTQIKEEDIKDSNFLYNFNAEQSPNLKERTNRESDVAFSGFDFTGVLDKYIDGMERYKSHAQGIKDLNTFLNIPSVKALLTNLSMEKIIKERINSTINPMSAKEAAFTNSFANKIFSKLTGFVLSFKLIQILKQATSFINAFEDYDYFGKDSKIPAVIRRRADFIMFMIDSARVYGSLFKDLVGKNGALREAMEISPDFKQRFIQGLQGDIYTLESASRKFIGTESKRFTKAGRAKATAKALAGAPTSIGDALGVLGYMVNYKRNIANGMNKSDAVAAFNNYNATQQTRRGTERTAIQDSTNYLTRAFTMFGSTVFLQINKVLSSSRNIFNSFTSGKLPRTKDVRSFYLNAAIANMMFVAASNIAKFIMGDEEDVEDALEDIAEAMFGMNLLYQIPLLGQTLEEFDIGGRIIAGLKDEEYKKKWANNNVVNPYSIMARKVIKSVNSEGTLLGAARPIAEATMGTQLDPFVAMYNMSVAEDDEEFNEEMLKSIGISSSYMPKHLRQDERDKELAKFIKEQEKRTAKYYSELGKRKR